MENNSKLSRIDVLEYALFFGPQGGADLLLLAGPGGFDGDYDEYLRLEELLDRAIDAQRK